RAGGMRFSSHLGGSGEDQAMAVAADHAGDAYLTGYTTSTDLPGANRVGGGGAIDAFVAKVHLATVTRVDDAGPGSLREAILRANSGGVSRISFDPFLAGQTIDLASPLPPINRDGTVIDGDLDFDCVPDIELNGAAAFGN